MTTENQNVIVSTEETAYSKATSIGRSQSSRAVEKPSTTLKTLSLRPTRSVKKNNSFKPLPVKRAK